MEAHHHHMYVCCGICTQNTQTLDTTPCTALLLFAHPPMPTCNSPTSPFPQTCKQGAGLQGSATGVC
jgi:hypothetical protein